MVAVGSTYEERWHALPCVRETTPVAAAGWDKILGLGWAIAVPTRQLPSFQGSVRGTVTTRVVCANTPGSPGEAEQERPARDHHLPRGTRQPDSGDHPVGFGGPLGTKPSCLVGLTLPAGRYSAGPGSGTTAAVNDPRKYKGGIGGWTRPGVQPAKCQPRRTAGKLPRLRPAGLHVLWPLLPFLHVQGAFA